MQQIEAAAANEPLDALARSLFKGADQAYAEERFDAAWGWYPVARWMELFGQDEAATVQRWAEVMNQAGRAHANLPRVYTPESGPLGRLVSPPLRAFLLRNRAFSQSFFELLGPYDHLPRVLTILDELFARDPSLFAHYAQLALAISLVHDVPPPPSWPHGQVSEQALPRSLPYPGTVYLLLIEGDRAGQTLHRINRLSAAELKYVVDVCATERELRWAQSNVKIPLAQLPATYQAIIYRIDRMQTNTMVWPGPSYELPTILAQGGICVDQAYFATQTGKARGVPTILFQGSGNDGRHAWFGYLDGHNRWQLNAGRYAEQKFITGVARDPQTWGPISDHELAFLADGFRVLPPYLLARQHRWYAQHFAQMEDYANAQKAARRAVNHERREFQAWDLLVQTQRLAEVDVRTREATLREAALALQRFPDLNAYFSRQLADSFRLRGETSAADFEDRMIARRNQAQRTDLSIAQAAELIRRARETQPVTGQIRIYNSAVDQFAHGGGIHFFDRVVAPFVTHLSRQNLPQEARRALDRARAALRPEPGSMLDREFAAAAAGIR